MAIVLWFLPRWQAPLASDHTVFDGPKNFRVWYLAALVAIVLVSIPGIDSQGRLTFQSRWRNSFHRFTWASGIEAMQPLPRQMPADQAPVPRVRDARPQVEPRLRQRLRQPGTKSRRRRDLLPSSAAFRLFWIDDFVPRILD